MRPVNLIPPDERRGDAAPLRTGHLIYVLVAGMALLLLGVVVVALTGKQINDREAKKADLQQELVQATAQAQSVQAFTNFRSVQENRATTVTSLAQSRFDWSRVLQELSLVLPSNVTLTSLTGDVSSQTTQSGSSSGSGGGDLRASVQGPALSIEGCAPGQDGVAGFVSALQDIDGVTRVGLSSSKVDDPAAGGSSSDSGGGSSDGSSAECFAGPRTATFEILIAFDSVPTSTTATTSPSVPPAAVPPSGGTQAVASTQTPGS